MPRWLPNSLRPELPDQTHSNEGGHLFLRIQLLSLHLQMAGMLLGGTSRRHIYRLGRSVGTGVLLREERLSPLSKLAEQYTPTSSVRKQEAALPWWSNSYPSPQLSFFFFLLFLLFLGTLKSIHLFRKFLLKRGLFHGLGDIDLTFKGLTGQMCLLSMHHLWTICVIIRGEW